MTRADARDTLRSIHPRVLAHALLQEIDTCDPDDSLETRAAYMVELVASGYPITADEAGGAARHFARKLTSQMDEGRAFTVATEDLADLLASDLPDVRLLALRLHGRAP